MISVSVNSFVLLLQGLVTSSASFLFHISLGMRTVC